MDAFLFSANAVLPVFMVILLGAALKRWRVLTDSFVDIGTGLVFRVALPCMLFLDIIEHDIRQTLDWRLLTLLVAGTLASVLLLRLLTPRFIKEPPSSAAFIQGVFRGNLVMVGMALVNNLGGSAAVAKMAMVLCVFAPLYNILGVLVLAEARHEQGARQMWRSIYTNPLLQAAMAGILFSLLDLKLPSLLNSPLSMLSQMALPLSLLMVGGTIEFSHIDAHLPGAVVASLLKTLLLPAMMLAVAYQLGFRGMDLILTLIVFGTPAANAGFPMAYQMGADYKLASLIILFSNLLSMLTLFLFVYALRSLALI